MNKIRLICSMGIKGSRDARRRSSEWGAVSATFAWTAGYRRTIRCGWSVDHRRRIGVDVGAVWRPLCRGASAIDRAGTAASRPAATGFLHDPLW